MSEHHHADILFRDGTRIHNIHDLAVMNDHQPVRNALEHVAVLFIGEDLDVLKSQFLQ